MQVYLTFDYELFFGSRTGSVKKCMVAPTRLLLDMCRKYRIGMTFFVDTGYLLKLEEFAPLHPELKNDLDEVKEQIAEMLSLNCAVQLHIHPHWEKSRYANGKWEIVTDGAYRLNDFSDEEIASIVRAHHSCLERIAGSKVSAYRAGGWCVQPFSRTEAVFRELGISVDSSVFPGGKFESKHYNFDFTAVKPFSDAYRFQSDVCREEKDGNFLEVPIASWLYRPAFYWRLYAMGRLRPSDHKMMGDGSFLAQPGRKRSVLTSSTWNHVSCDGYYASMLQLQAKAYRSKGVEHFVVIGHPKGLTRFSVRKLEAFIVRNRNKYDFSTFNDL
jgi:peptidoglycan/xylan/chitin deacetylase (PgdA/CDA1 family)